MTTIAPSTQLPQTERSLAAPHAPALYTDRQSKPAGLVEDGARIECLLLDRRYDLRHWRSWSGSSRLITLRACDYPGREGQRMARIELPAEALPHLPHLIRGTVPLGLLPATTTTAGEDAC
ncbi:hypothetical protein KBP30_00380 [Streptomyces sp. Go40/10]|uniref:hypothetical protein n=1 Tax=Streptomyces sp. Go40/10 TaxID=2825844 RepID=UPI001E4BAD95|nr:hypothetical protein [Streptomyces sp. Go40/10]UFQ99787.1 hypothetical protein KBP30_00380 [Streptomyces sp. Go40/10]